MDKFALVEIGECDKDGYVYYKGEETVISESTLAHTYWYPDDITFEEIDTELKDLAEHYENVIVLLPIPAQLHIEVLKHEG